MNRIYSLAVLCALHIVGVCVESAVADAPRKVTLSPQESVLTWTGKKVTGAHTGKVALQKGEVVIERDAITSGAFEISLANVTVTDIEDPENNAKLVKHLKSGDFFASDAFPTAQFTIVGSSPLEKPLPTGENTAIRGSLTIKGITQSVEFPAKVEVKGSDAVAQGRVTLDRTKWDIRYGSGKFFQGLGDKLIYDDFEVDFSVKGKIAG